MSDLILGWALTNSHHEPGAAAPDHFRNAGVGCAFTLPNNAFLDNFAGYVEKSYLSEITLLLYICLIIGRSWNIIDEHSVPKLQL